MGRDPLELASYVRPLLTTFLDECESQGCPCRVVDTGRSVDEQSVKIALGVSWTQHSKHLPQPPEGLSEAFDVVPNEILEEHKPDWDITNPVWHRIGIIGESLGLVWGGRWTHINNGNGDPGHFQWAHSEDLEVRT